MVETYVVCGVVVIVVASLTRSGRIALRHAWPWLALALAIAAHRFKAGNPLVQLLRAGEKHLGNGDTPVLIEHFVTGILCTWAASIVVRALPWMAREARQQYQQRRVPGGLFWMIVCLPLAVAGSCYLDLGLSPVSIAPFLLSTAFLWSLAMRPARTVAWASKHHWLMCLAIALCLWAFLSISFAYCQFQTHVALTVHNATQQLLASSSGLLVGLAVRALWVPVCLLTRGLLTSMRRTAP
ncbi:MAG: hypothetical protein EPN57_18395 [Paraburkholderia sp.]|nr:MAG: hypothetical protein EPN57_18395 [Paraburkholderia sp.]